MEEPACAAVVGLVVPGVDPVEVLPRVNHGALLRVVLRELAIECAIPAALVAVVPEHDRRMIDVAVHELRNERHAGRRAVRLLPSRELVEHVEAERVGDIEEMAVGRIVRHPHRVHVHLLHELHVGDAERLVRRAAGRGPEGVAVASLEVDRHAIDVEAVVRPHFDGAETEGLDHLVDGRTTRREPHAHAVAVGPLRRPGPHASDRRAERDTRATTRHGDGEGRADGSAVHLLHLRGGAVDGRRAVDVDLGAEGAGVACVDRDVGDVLHRRGLEPHRAEDAAEQPEITLAFGAVDRGIGGELPHRDLEQVVVAGLHQIGDVVAELVEAAAMRRSGTASIDADVGIGHRRADDDGDAPAAPFGGDAEAVAILADAVGRRRA